MKSGLLFYFLLFALISCGKNSGSNEMDQQQVELGKDLFARWTRADGYVLDLTRASFNTQFPVNFFSNGTNCTCELTLSGDETSGTIQYSSCSYTGGGPGSFNCLNLNKRENYFRTRTGLQVCGISNTQCDFFM